MRQVLAAGEFADRMHGKGRQADVHGAHAELAGGDRADGRAAAHVAAGDEALHRYFVFQAQVAEEACGFAAGGVALVAVDLDHRAGIEFRAVVAVVLVGIVRVNGVGIVGGDQQRAVDRALEIVLFGQQATQHLFEEGTVGATHRGRADFFVVGADQYAGFVRAGVEQGLQAREAGQQVVQPGAGDEVAVEADDRRRLGVVEAQFEVQHHIGDRPCSRPSWSASRARKSELSWLAICARIGGSSFWALIAQPGGFPVEVDREVGNAGDRLPEIDQLAFDAPVAAVGDAPGQG